MGDVDIALRQVTTRRPEDIARRFVSPDQTILSMRWLDTQLAVRERRIDKGLLVELAQYRVAIHNEWFIENASDMAWRMYEYGCELQEVIRQEDLAHAAARARVGSHVATKRLYVESCAVVLDGPEVPLASWGEWMISPPSTPQEHQSVVRFRIEAVYQRTTEQLLAHPGMLWLVFAPLARDVSEVNLRLAVQAARERAHSREELDDIASAMHILAVARPKNTNLSTRIVDMFKEEGLIERTWLFQHGLEKGLETGIEKGVEKGIKRGIKEGVVKGVEQGLRDALFDILVARGLRANAAQRKLVSDTHDVLVLRKWIAQAATSKTVTELFTQSSVSAPAKPRRRS
jgi:hypothetical protein